MKRKCAFTHCNNQVDPHDGSGITFKGIGAVVCQECSDRNQEFRQNSDGSLEFINR